MCGGAGANVGRGIWESRGSAAETGLCAQDNTPAFDGARACSVGEPQPLCLKEISAADSICNDWM